MEEQPQLESVIEQLYEQGITKERIIELLVMIVKQQMLYGGSLEEKINYNPQKLIR